MAVAIGRPAGTTPASTAQVFPHDAFRLGPYQAILRTITFDSTYAVGGEDLLPETVKFNKIFAVAVLDINTSAVEVRYSIADRKLIVETAKLAAYTSGDEAIDFTDLADLVVTVLILGA